MSFVSDYSDVIICNRALSMLPEAPIASLDGNSLAARHCKQWYKPTVRRVLGMHQWGLPTVRKALALRAENDRPEWSYRYATPADLAFASSVSTFGQPLYRGHDPRLHLFERIGNSVYTNLENAALDYVSLNITEADFDENLVLIIERLLASRLAMPITKRSELASELEKAGLELANMAMATDQNQRGLTYGDAPTESELVREGSYWPS